MPENRKQQGGLTKNTTEKGRSKDMSPQRDHGRNRGDDHKQRNK